MKVKTVLSFLVAIQFTVSIPYANADFVPWRGNQAYYIEATEAEITAPFEFIEDTDALSGVHITYPDPTNEDNENQDAPADGHAVFTLRNIDPGSYYLHGRILGHDFDSDSFWVLVNDDDLDNAVAWNTASHQSEWGWWHYPHHGEAPATIELDHGENTITIIRRKSNTRLDALVLTRDVDFSPSDEQLLPEYSEPDWWSWEGPDGSLDPVTTEDSPDDLALAVAGQLKHTATMARKKMDENFPGGAGEDIDNVATWDPEAADDHVVINLGQLKAVALPFYDRLQTVVADGEHFYPWPEESPDEDNYAAATLGQLKHVFSFEIPLIDPEPPEPWNPEPSQEWLEQFYTQEEIDELDPIYDRENALTVSQHWMLQTDPRMDGPISFSHTQSGASDPTFRADMTWTSGLDYIEWAQERVAQEMGGLAEEPSGDDLPNYFKFALEWHPDISWPAQAPYPEITANSSSQTITFIRRKNEHLEKSRIGWWVETQDGAVVDIISESLDDNVAGLDDSFEEVTWTVEETDPVLVVMRVEPKPLLFAHYVAAYAAGIDSQSHLALPWPSHGRLVERFGGLQVGGRYRDLALMPPGQRLEPIAVSCPDDNSDEFCDLLTNIHTQQRIASLRLQIGQARRAGVDGFAIDVWHGGYETARQLVTAAFEAAAQEYAADRADPDIEDPEPFLIAVVPDWTTIAGHLENIEEIHTTSRFLVEDDPDRVPATPETLAKQLDGIAETVAFSVGFLEHVSPTYNNHTDPDLADDPTYTRHHTHRGGMPAVMGYASTHWVDIGFGHLFGLETQEEVVAAKRGDDVGRMTSDVFREIERRVTHQVDHDGNPDIDPSTLDPFSTFWQLTINHFFNPEHGAKQPPENLQDYIATTGELGRYFHAVNEFFPTRQEGQVFSPEMREEARDSGAEWGEALYLEYENEATHSYFPWEGASGFGDRWQPAIDDHTRSSLIQFTTWNDYAEKTNLAPGFNSRYLPMFLNNHFATVWKTGEPPEYEKEKVYIAHLKYPKSYDGQDIAALPFTTQVDRHPDAPIEVITVLNEPAERIEVTGDGGFERAIYSGEIPSGFSILSFPGDAGDTADVFSEGVLMAEVERDEEVILSVESPEPITHNPFRQDFGVVGMSDAEEFERQWDLDFEDRVDEDGQPIGEFLYSEYGDTSEDGIPNWFSMYHLAFGWIFPDILSEDMSQYDSQYDDFLEGDNPTFVTRQAFPNGDPWGLPTTIPAENFDFGGQFVAYLKSGRFGNPDSANFGSLPYRGAEIGEWDNWKEDEDFQVAEFVQINEAGGRTFVHDNQPGGDWLEYTVSVNGSPEFVANVELRSDSSGKLILSFFDSEDNEVVNKEIDFPDTGGSWSSYSSATFAPPAGEHRLRLTFDSGDVDIDYIQISAP